MHTNLLAAIIFLCAALIFAGTLIWRRLQSRSTSKQETDLSAGLASARSASSCDISILDENGFRVLESKEIARIPARAHRVESSGSAIGRVKHIAADLFRGVSSVPNKTVEVVFNPEIQQGLTDGAYTLMQTKAGETLADAVDSSGSIVGKGRLIQTGKARQLIGGAFQLVSIAVAQSHLADIEHSLSALKDAISEIIERQENEDRARITGAFDYLREIAGYMKEFRCPDELSSQKRNAIEAIIKDSYAWRNKLEEDTASLISTVKNLKDLDTFGTENTYQSLKKLIERMGPLLKRRQLFLNLASAIDFVTAYLDPARREFSRIDVKTDKWTQLINELNDAASNKESELMGKALWNSNETLGLRRDKLRSLSLSHQQTAIDQQSDYAALHTSLDASMKQLIDPDGSIHVAIAFDARGEVDGAAII